MECVQLETHDGGVDAVVDGALSDAPTGIDAGTLSTKLIVASATADALYVFDAETLSILATVPLPDRAGTGSQFMQLTGADILWITSDYEVLSMDPKGLSVLQGPKTFDLSQCRVIDAYFIGTLMYCLRDQAGTANDAVVAYAGLSLVYLTEFKLPAVFRIGGSASRVAVSYGAQTVAVVDPALAPVPNSPASASNSTFPVTRLAMSDPLNRLALAGGTDVQIHEASTLAPLGVQHFGGNSGTEGTSGVGFDTERRRVLVTFVDGNIAALDADNASVVLGKADLGTSQAIDPTYDRTRDRVYVVVGNQLAVLDAESLTHVSGSPIALPTACIAVEYR
jgi:hypothetical protein